MNASWDDEYLTVNEIAEHLKLNQQTLRNWIDQGSLPAVRIGRRVRIRRADLDRILAQGMTGPVEPQPSAVAPADSQEQLERALERARRLLGQEMMARRVELEEALQDLSDAVAETLRLSSDESSPADGVE